MYIEVDVYDNSENYITRRKIINSGETFSLSGLQAETQYNVRSRRNLNGLFSPYTISSFTTESTLSLFAFYFKSVNFANSWNGTLYAKNLNTNQEYIIDTNVIVFNFWTIPKTSKNGKFIFYHKLVAGDWYFIVKNLETNEVIYNVLAVSGLSNTWVFANWKANSSEIIHSLYSSVKRFYNTTTQTATFGQPTWSGGWAGVVLSNDVCIYNDNINSHATRRINYDGTDFEFITGADGYASMSYIVNEDESNVFFGGIAGSIHKLRKINTSDYSVTEPLSYNTTGGGFYINGHSYTRIIDDELYCQGVDGSNYSLWKYNVLTNQLNHVKDDNNLYILADVNVLNSNWFV